MYGSIGGPPADGVTLEASPSYWLVRLVLRLSHSSSAAWVVQVRKARVSSNSAESVVCERGGMGLRRSCGTALHGSSRGDVSSYIAPKPWKLDTFTRAWSTPSATSTKATTPGSLTIVVKVPRWSPLSQTSITEA